MSVQAIAWVLENSRSRGLDRLVLIVLANHHNKGTGRCDPGMRLIAHEAGIAIGTVTAATRRLAALGELVIETPGDARHTSKYRLAFMDPPSVQETNAAPDGERSGHERSARPRGERSVQPRGEQNRKEPEGTSLAPATRTRERDELFEAVCRVAGIDWRQLTDLGRGPVNRAVRDLRKLGASPHEVSRRAVALRHRYPTAAVTPTSLAKHWAALGPPPADDDDAETRELSAEERETIMRELAAS